MPRVNYEKARDEMNILVDESIRIHPIVSAEEIWKPLLGLSADTIVERIRSCESKRDVGERKKGAITNCPITR